jgi:sec-independent protein translocase protein TatA
LEKFDGWHSAWVVSAWHWLVVGVIILLLFGKGRFSDMMGDVAKGLKSFKKGMSEDDEAAPAPPPPPIEGERTVDAAGGAHPRRRSRKSGASPDLAPEGRGACSTSHRPSC